jgi:alkylation response protein AidB-like acyl-CoA dehydrogenase
MGHYKANVRDIEFNLFEVLDLEKALATGEFGDLDGEAVRQMLAEAARLAQGPLAYSFADGDRHPPQFDPDTHAVRLPESFKTSVWAWQRAGWPLLGLDEELGSVHVPATVNAAINEFLLGGQPAAFFYLTGPAMLSVLHRVGTPQQRRWAEIGIERNWGAAMVLTEPDAGSDVGSARTRAVDQHDGTWHIEGVKRFITSGDSDDLFENIAHLVLARPVGAPPGSKGLSLFLVPKYLFDPQTGAPGDRNGVFATALEHKMGLTASATCELAFGQHGVPAVGWLVGDTHSGIAQMFGIMLYARLMVGIKSIATLSTGYLNALEFAKTRVQGPDLTRDDRQDRTARSHHQPPRRAAVLVDPEGVRRRASRAVSVCRGPSRSGLRSAGVGRIAATGRQHKRPAVTHRQGVRGRSVRTLASPNRFKSLEVRGICAIIRSSSMSAMPRSTRFTNARRRFRRRISSSAK